MSRTVLRGQSVIHVCSKAKLWCNLSLNIGQTIIAGLFRVSLFIDFGCLSDLGIGWRGAFGTFMVSRPILQGSDWWKFIIWNEVMGINQSDSSMGIFIWTGFGQGFTQVSGKGSVKGLGKCLGRVLAMLYMDAWIIMLFHRLILCIWKVYILKEKVCCCLVLIDKQKMSHKFIWNFINYWNFFQVRIHNK